MEEGVIELTGETMQAINAVPLISVITVTRNAEQILEPTILSVLNQTYLHIEYIIIDGASTDGTMAIIKKYEDKLAYYISEPDGGIYDAMNKGVNAAKGDRVYFLGAGDTLLNVIHHVVPKMTDTHCLYYGDVYRTDLQRIYDGKYSPFKLAVHNICQQAIFYPLSALKKHKFNTKYRSMADHVLNMQLYGDKNYRLKYLPVTVGMYSGAGFSELNLDYPYFNDKLKIIYTNFPLIVFLYAYIRTAIAKTVKPNYLKKNSKLGNLIL